MRPKERNRIFGGLFAFAAVLALSSAFDPAHGAERQRTGHAAVRMGPIAFAPMIDVVPAASGGLVITPLELDARKCQKAPANDEFSECAARCGGASSVSSCTVGRDPDTGVMTKFCACKAGPINPNLQVRGPLVQEQFKEL